MLADSAKEAEDLLSPLQYAGHIDEILVVQRFTTSFKEKFIGLCKSVDNAIVCHNILPYLRENQNDSDGNCQKLRELLGRWVLFRVLASL